MLSRQFEKKHTLVSFSKTSNYTRPSDSCDFDLLAKLPCTCFFQIALETIVLPIQIINITTIYFKFIVADL